MSEKEVVFQSGGLSLEGLLCEIDGEKAVVVTHPHPLYGGDMRNHVVSAITQAYAQTGYTTFRFNFRGVGKSEGHFAQGLGEQDDVLAALEFLASLGKRTIDLAGYSFGAWVNALGTEKFPHAGRLVMVAPPVNFVDFTSLESNPRIELVIVGSDDDLGPPSEVRRLLAQWNPSARLSVLQGADHFFFGSSAGKIESILRDFLAG